MEQQVAGDKTDVIQIVDVAGGEIYKQVVDQHDQQNADDTALREVLVDAGCLVEHGVPNTQRGLYGSARCQPQVDFVVTGGQLQRHHEVAVAHRPLAKGLFVSQAVLGLQCLPSKMVQAHIVQEGNRQLYDAR